LTMLRVESRQFSATAPAFNLPQLHLAPPLRGDPGWVLPRFSASENRVPGLSCGVVYVILCLVASVEHRLVADRHTDRQTHMTTVCTALAWHREVKSTRSSVSASS